MTQATNQYNDRYIPFEYIRHPFFVGEGIGLASTYHISGGVKVYRSITAPSLKARKNSSGQWLSTINIGASNRIGISDKLKYSGYAELLVNGKGTKRHNIKLCQFGGLSPDYTNMELSEPFALPSSGHVEIKIVMMPFPICHPDGCTPALITTDRAAYRVKII